MDLVIAGMSIVVSMGAIYYSWQAKREREAMQRWMRDQRHDQR